MAEQTINAASNPGLANQMVKDALANVAPVEEKAPLIIREPIDGTVTLPGGYLSASGEVITTATVRELNGHDEEAIARQGSYGKSLTTILSRAVVKVGDEAVTETVLDNLLAGDADALMVGIYRTTFGDTANIGSYCEGCKEIKQVEVSLSEDLVTKALLDPIADRIFTVKGKSVDYTVRLPNRKTQKEMIISSDKNSAELNSILLEGCLVQIGSRPVLSKLQVQEVGIADRRVLVAAILARNPGPKFDVIEVDCADCGGKVDVPISLGTIFRS